MSSSIIVSLTLLQNLTTHQRNSCPTCRRPITNFELDISQSSMAPLQDWELINRITMGVRRVLAMNPQEEGLVDASAQHQGQQDPPDRDDRDEFSGMYS